MEQLETEIYLRYKQIIESQKAWYSSCHAGQVLFDHLQLLLLSGHDPRMGTASPFSRAAPQSSRIYSGTGSPFSCENAQPRSVTLLEIIDSYDAFCFDGYGTLYNRGSFVYPGAMEWFQALRRAGKHLRLVTNAASDVDEVLARDADKRGFDFTTAETISSGSLLKDLVQLLFLFAYGFCLF